MKKIRVKEAAEMLGITRQTLENWGRSGIIKIHKAGSTENAHWVDLDTINAISDTAADVEQAKTKLESVRKEISSLLEEEQKILHDVNRELFIVRKIGASVSQKNFYKTIPAMLHNLNVINYREMQIMLDVIDGTDIRDIADKYFLTSSRIFQIFGRGCKKASEVVGLLIRMNKFEDTVSELDSVKRDNESLKSEVARLTRELHPELQGGADEKAILQREADECDRILNLLKTPIADIDLSVRSLNSINAAGVRTLEDLVQLDRLSLLKMRNMGIKSLHEIEDMLDNMKLGFNTDVEHIRRRKVRCLSLLSNNNCNDYGNK